MSGFYSRGCGVLASLGLLLAAGCGTPTSTTQVWKAETVVRAPMRRVVVFGGGLSETGRRVMEDGFVASLGARGVAARPSYELLPTLPDKDSARAAVEAAGFEGVLVATLHGIREKVSYVPGGSGFWGGYYGGTWAPDSVVTDRDRHCRRQRSRDLRAGGAGALVWSATTQTTNPTSAADAVKSLTKELVPKLSEGGLIPTKE